MMSIFAILSDIPYYIAGFISELTGADLSAVTDGFSKLISSLFDAFDKFIA